MTMQRREYPGLGDALWAGTLENGLPIYVVPRPGFRRRQALLAVNYGAAAREIEAATGRSWERLYIAGGGAKNALLNELTARATGKKVIALPIEATALGNLKIQMTI